MAITRREFFMSAAGASLLAGSPASSNKEKEKIKAKVTNMNNYFALPLQITCDALNGLNKKDAKSKMLEKIKNINRQIKASKAWIGPELKLVVLPEYFLTSFPMGESINDWKENFAVNKNGDVVKALQEVAKENDIFLSGNLYVKDPSFPKFYFQSSMIWSPKGKTVLDYVRLNSMFTPTPHDVFDQYVEKYGYDALFPVVETEIGALACIASEEILFPEIARCLAFKGAEIFLHSSSEVHSRNHSPKRTAKLARAFENNAFVVSANSAGISGISIPENSTDGGSMIVNYKGQIINEAEQGESMTAYSRIELDSLKKHRSSVSMDNMFARQRLELYSKSYLDNSVYPVNTLEKEEPTRKHFKETMLKSIKKLTKRGMI